MSVLKFHNLITGIIRQNMRLAIFCFISRGFCLRDAHLLTCRWDFLWPGAQAKVWTHPTLDMLVCARRSRSATVSTDVAHCAIRPCCKVLLVPSVMIAALRILEFGSAVVDAYCAACRGILNDGCIDSSVALKWVSKNG